MKWIVCDCELTKHICTLQSKLSYHLKMLLEAELIDVVPTGKWNFYKIRPAAFEQILSPEVTKKILAKFDGIGGNIIAALLGTVTPFCSCSSMPIFFCFTRA